jgi:phosphotriesterase-related protein
MRVRSVLGPVELDDERVVLPHEHVIIDYRQKEGAAPPPDRVDEDGAVAVLERLAASGVQAVVDCTPPGYGRDLDFLRVVSRRSGVHVVASTGTFCEQWSPVPPWVAAADSDRLAAVFAAELERGCGVIKVATSARMAPIELTALTAASLAHAATGASIVSHTTGGLGLEQLDVFERNGVDLTAVLVSHVCAADEPAQYAVEIARRGAYVGLDRVGHASHGDQHWVDVWRTLLEKGLGDRVLLSHDSVQRFDGPEAIAAHTYRGIDHITGGFRRHALGAGIDPDTFHEVTVRNPLRWLSTNRDVV